MASLGKAWTSAVYIAPGSVSGTLPTPCFLPGVPVTVKIQAGERLNPHSHPVGTVIFRLELQHGPFTWQVTHRFGSFTILHTRLTLYRAKEQIRMGVAKGFSGLLPTETIPHLPRFPGRPDTMMTSTEHLEERRAALETYLNQVLQLEFFKENADLIEFLEVSRFSFIKGSIKGKEGWVKKRHGDRLTYRNLVRWRSCVWCRDACTAHLSTQWGSRWLVVRDTFLMYISPDTGMVQCVLLFDKDFQLRAGFNESGTRRGVVLETGMRSLYLKSAYKRAGKELTLHLQNLNKEPPAGWFTAQNRFGSFAPVRERGQAACYVDGADYMAAVADAIQKAREEIFIADWWLSPDLLLKRGPAQERWRLCSLLRSRAEAGVQICILLYKEIAAVLSINSAYSKQRLLRHPNIRVARHPDHAPIPSMWAHHEKMVVVDQSAVFLGGIDLCFGRWDDHRHRLADTGQKCGESVLSPTQPGATATAAGAGTTATAMLASSCLKIINSTRPNIQEGVRSVTALLLQQHGVIDLAVGPAIQTFTETSSTTEAVRVETEPEEKKNLRRTAQSVLLKVRTIKELAKRGKDKDSDSVESLSLELGTRDEVVSSSPDPTNEKSPAPLSTCTWPGKDYVNWIVRDMFQPELADQDTVDRATTPRMPWHDIGIGVTGWAARDAARHFIQRWNAVKEEKLKQNPNYPLLVPKSYVETQDEGYYRQLLKLPTNVRSQAVRSCGHWSAGQAGTEASIHTAMLETIRSAEHYVYIENQFFISLVQTPDLSWHEDVKNGISTAIFDRILQAKSQKKNFRVYVLLPLLPAFEGDVAGETGHGMRAIMHYQYRSIARGTGSLIARLEAAGVQDWQQYLGFFSLRAHDELQGVPVTELIYIHSKLLIADDRRLIVSSANINDRSLLGDRDSEVGVVIDDTEFILGRMDGKPFDSGKCAGGLRKKLFTEHLGLLEQPLTSIDLEDPVSEDFFIHTWTKIATANTKLFTELFSVLPSDQLLTRKDSKQLQVNHRPLVETFSLGVRPSIAKIQGSLVLFPLRYLENENLQPPHHVKEGLVSYQLWT